MVKELIDILYGLEKERSQRIDIEIPLAFISNSLKPRKNLST